MTEEMEQVKKKVYVEAMVVSDATVGLSTDLSIGSIRVIP